ncbi:hypothetical protein NDU88_006699 [Pleurodeles waltl]|uniref:L1 transposable element RRM domain-containing protein n=1 Tax=Pleurodeles waltl TaxID=8319 RepID=A0AAV7TXT5_PLEWA|nr:hypothetical protein NDU88_006699 [Pleurodeles waltl]
MPSSKPNHKPTGKPVRQLLFSEALHQKRPTPMATETHSSPPPTQPVTTLDKEQSTTMERILHKITAVSRRIEGMDASISSLTLETKSMRLDIAGFQSRVTGLEHRMGSLETQMATSQDRDQDLLYLKSKLTDLEDRSRRDNIRLLGIPENEEAHRVGPKCSDPSLRPRLIIACLLRHNQTRHILQTARSHGPFRIGQHDIRITADYSKDTNERKKAFLALRPRLRQLEMKYGLVDPARMWVTKNGVSRDFYNPEELKLFLDSFQHQSTDFISTNRPLDDSGENRTLPPGLETESTTRHDTDTGQRGRDLERLARSYDDRGQVLHAVAVHTQLSERDESCSPLKPAAASP